MNEDTELFFEAKINNYNFRYYGGLMIEVTKVNDKQHNVLREISVTQPLKTKKDFDKEISFWFMENCATLQ